MSVVFYKTPAKVASSCLMCAWPDAYLEGTKDNKSLLRCEGCGLRYKHDETDEEKQVAKESKHGPACCLPSVYQEV